MPATPYKLEILSAYPKADPKTEPKTKQGTPAAPFQLLFVHGICVGAWVWNDSTLPFFAQHGYPAHAVSLRGHGNSSGYENITQFSLADYTEDLAHAVATLQAANPAPVVVIGHSLGGAVVQNWLRTGGQAAGAALLASVPPWGLAKSAFIMGLTHPFLFQEIAKMIAFGVNAANPDVLRQGLFSESFSNTDFDAFSSMVTNESPLVSAQVQGLNPLAPMPWQTPPMFVAGGDADCFIPASEVRNTASYYGTTATIIPHMAHTFMLEESGQALNQALLCWLQTLS